MVFATYVPVFSEHVHIITFHDTTHQLIISTKAGSKISTYKLQNIWILQDTANQIENIYIYIYIYNIYKICICFAYP